MVISDRGIEMTRSGKKKEDIKIADNPLSKNIATKLGYYDPNIGPKGIKARLEKVEADVSRIFPGKNLSAQTIETWITPNKKDETRPQRFPSMEYLTLFASVLEISDP